MGRLAHRLGALLGAVAVLGCARQSRPVAVTDAFSSTIPQVTVPAQSGPKSQALAPRAPSDSELRQAVPDTWIVAGVRRELDRVAVAQHRLDVRSRRGVVVLTGEVDEESQRASVLKHATRVRGVRAVVGQIEVSPEHASDAQIREQVQARLKYHPTTEHHRLRAHVQQGVVTLHGALNTFAERAVAQQAVQAVRGLRAIDNRIVVTSALRSSDDVIADALLRQLSSDTRLLGAQIAVRVNTGRVFLGGEVKSDYERRIAREVAWIPGVHAVRDDDLRAVPDDGHLRPSDAAPPSDNELTAALLEALRQDPRIAPGAVTVHADAGSVTLEGIVEDPAARLAAEQNALHTIGARSVNNRIQVRLAEGIEDSALQRRVTERLEEHPGITAEGIRIAVANGLVSLRGYARSAYERSRAASAASGVRGVRGVTNQLEVREPEALGARDDATIQREIERALLQDPRVLPNRVRVEVKNGVATLLGQVEDWGVYDAVLENVFQVLPLELDNRLEYHGPTAPTDAQNDAP